MSLKIISVGVALILLLLAALVILENKLDRANLERDQAINYSLAKDDSLKYLTTKLGKESALTHVQDLTIRNLRRLQSDKELSWIKEIKGIKKSLRNVEQISSTTARAIASFKMPLRDTFLVVNNDTIVGRTFDNENKWIRERGVIYPDTVITNPEVFVPLQSAVYWERKKGFLGLRWFGRKEWFKQTTSENPYVRITEDRLTRVSKKKRK